MIGFMLLLVSSACSPALTPGAHTRTKISIADLGLVPQAPVYIAMDRGYFADEDLEPTLVSARTTTEISTLAATGEVDFGGAAPDPALFNAMEHGIQIKLLASGGVFQRPLTRGSGIVVRQDLLDNRRYTALADLKGFKIAVSSVQSQFYVEQILNQAGLTAADVEITTLGLPEMSAALENHAIDAAWMVEPLLGAASARKLGQQVASGVDAMPGGISWVVFSGDTAAGTSPDIAARFMCAYMRGLRDYYHAAVLKDASPGPILDALAAHSSIQDRKVLENVGLHNVDPNGALDLASLDRIQDYYVTRGFQQQRVDLSQFVDTAPLEAALQTLGRVS
jgi:NitT/TauT family transport system substrate-binding protein